MQALKIFKSGQIGKPCLFNSVFTQPVEAGNITVKYWLKQKLKVEKIIL